MNVRNAYLITHAFRNYLWASLMSSAIMQLTVTVDAVILGHYVGSDALSAVSLVMPLTMLVSALSTLIGVGPAIMASRAIGNREYSKVNLVFTSAVFQAVIIGGCIGVGCWGFSAEIASLLCGDGQLLPYLSDYLQVIPWCFGLTILVSSFVALKDAGRPFNPVLPLRDINLEDSEVSLGLALVNSVCNKLSHKYMYGQNVVFAEFQSERTLY